MPQHGLIPCKFSHFAMGTTFEVIFAEIDTEYGQQASQEIFNEIDRLEALLSRFNPCSEISMINRLKEGQSLSVSVDVYHCLEKAYSIQEHSQGAFDVNYSDPTQNFPERKNNSVELKKTKQGFFVEFATNQPELVQGHLALDMGGIGKGFALDRALDMLHEWSIDNALIHGGTSTAIAVGNPSEIDQRQKGWPVGVGGNWPILKEYRFFLRARALSGSGKEVKGGHIINPRTGQEASGHLGAWVSHPSAAVADALSTAFTVMSPSEVAAYCEMFPETWALVLIDPGHFDVYNDVLKSD